MSLPPADLLVGRCGCDFVSLLMLLCVEGMVKVGVSGVEVMPEVLCCPADTVTGGVRCRPWCDVAFVTSVIRGHRRFCLWETKVCSDWRLLMVLSSNVVNLYGEKQKNLLWTAEVNPVLPFTIKTTGTSEKEWNDCCYIFTLWEHNPLYSWRWMFPKAD